VVVVGAGPGGAAVTAALRKGGHHVTLVGPKNQSSTSPAARAPSGVWSPGLTALYSIDADACDYLVSRGTWVTRSGYTDHLTGEWLLTPTGGGLRRPDQGRTGAQSLLFVDAVDLEAVTQRLAGTATDRVTSTVVSIQRDRRHAAPEESTPKRVRADETMVVHTACGDAIDNVDVVVGADGLDSTIRRISSSTTDAHTCYPVRQGYTVYRGIADCADAVTLPEAAAFQCWGPHRRFAAVPLTRHRASWFATVADAWHADVPAPGTCGTAVTAALLEEYAGWDPRVAELLSATTPASVVWEDARSLSAAAFDGGSAVDGVALVGDAAHCVDPVLAQGIGVAFEDAACLGTHLITRDTHVRVALMNYMNDRRYRTRILRRLSVVNQWLGQDGCTSQVAIAARNMAMRGAHKLGIGRVAFDAAIAASVVQ
jgi:2-polyprenyl-6-methoxyphenol hydroxylase-like FAD-dependent oxidoreductase